MAVSGFDFVTPTIKQHNYDPASNIIMDKQSLDLNKQALDLNEVPSNELGLDLREASCSHDLGSSLHPRRGGWLELFRNMFGHDKMMSDSGPFASCTTMLNSRYINHMPQADGILHHSDPRLVSCHGSQLGEKIYKGHAVSQNGDAAKDRITETSNLAFIPDKQKKSCKPFTSEEFNHTNVYASAPLFSHAAAGGSHIKNPSVNASGQPGCATSVLPPFFSSPEGLKPKTGIGPWDKGPQRLSGLYSNVDQASVASSISRGFDHYKASIPMWDLTSQPFPQWAADFQSLRHAEASCITSSGLFSQMHVMEKIERGGLPAQVSEVAPMEAKTESGALTICPEKEKVSSCPSKKGSGRSDREKLTGLMNGGNALCLSEDKEKFPDPRVRIIDSPDWLPTGWITEVKTRMAGSTAGTTDKYYKDPVTGRRFRSKNEVLSFLQTGRLCRNKPQFRPLECFATTSTLPFLIPRQDQSVGSLDNSQAVLARTTYLTSANDFSCQASMCQTLCPPNVILERFKINEGQMNVTSFPSGSSDVLRASDKGPRVEGSGSCTEFDANDVGKPYMSGWPGISNACMHNETVQNHKRNSDSVSLLSPKRLRSTVKELRGKEKWLFCMEQTSRDADRHEFSSGVECDIKTAQSSYPGLLNRQEPSGAHDKAVTDYLTARYKANLKALGLYDASMIRNASEVNLGYTKELQPRTASVIKVGEKKSVKLILKQERDLLVTLGRNLCVEFLASAKGSSLGSMKC
ncbi:hypothetical protein GOP47_0013001 [Adiantum capillus-veneris]|uniref:MBD domain-containing protein n=1 Tax=Adiantum capillus-veneris TaxID=13818 RepID=A0A9D4ZH25_ADICA|nr:hypothetical protein GOP47_0013001 [Adiantum capillus-veneris]